MHVPYSRSLKFHFIHFHPCAAADLVSTRSLDVQERDEDEYEDHSEGAENDSDDYSEDGRKAPKSHQGLNGLSVGSSRPSCQRPTLPKAGARHPDYVLSKGGVAQMKIRKDLHISPGYGRTIFGVLQWA